MSNCCNTKINFPSDKFKDCCEVIFTNCIAYTGPEGCLDFGTYPNLNDVIGGILTHICAAQNLDAACLISKGYQVSDIASFTHAVSDVICQILGCQIPSINDIPGTITSLCALNNRMNVQTVLPCFKTIASLGANATMEQLFTGLQSVVCQLASTPPPVVTDQFVKCSATDTTAGYLSQKLQGGQTVKITTQNAGANEVLKPEIVIDPASTIPWSVSANGLKLDCCTPPAVTDAAIQCAQITKTGSVNSNSAINAVTIKVPYTATVGGSYPAIVIPSVESVSGKPVAYASCPAGSFAAGGGNLVFNVTGDTTGYSGSSVSFMILVNGSQCLVRFDMIVATVYQMICDQGYWNLIANPMQVGVPVTAITGSPYLQVQVNVNTLGTPATISIDAVTVAGLTFAAVSNFHLTLGSNLIHIPFSGTPTATNFTVPISIGGTLACNFQLQASPAATIPGSYIIQCANCQALGSTLLPQGTSGNPYNQNISICYVSGVDGPVAGLSVIGYWLGSLSPSGLTLVIPPGTISAASGNIAATVSGTPTGFGTIVFNIPNSKCSLTVPVNAPGAIVDIECNVQPRGMNVMETVSVSMTQVNGTAAVLDWPHQTSVSAYPGYYIGSGGLGFHAANLAYNQTATISYTDSMAPHYQSYITHVHVDYFDSSGAPVSSQDFDQNAPGNFTSPTGMYILGGRVYYTSYNIALVIPPSASRVVFIVVTP